MHVYNNNIKITHMLLYYTVIIMMITYRGTSNISRKRKDAQGNIWGRRVEVQNHQPWGAVNGLLLKDVLAVGIQKTDKRM